MVIYVYLCESQDQDDGNDNENPIFYCTVKLNNLLSITKATHTFQDHPQTITPEILTYKGEFISYSTRAQYEMNEKNAMSSQIQYIKTQAKQSSFTHQPPEGKEKIGGCVFTEKNGKLEIMSKNKKDGCLIKQVQTEKVFFQIPDHMWKSHIFKFNPYINKLVSKTFH